MPNFFSRDFSDFFLGSYRIWFRFHCRSRKIDAASVAGLERLLFPAAGTGPAMELSPFGRELAREAQRRAFAILLGRAGGPDGPADLPKVRELLAVPLSDERAWDFVLGLHLHDLLRRALGRIRPLERFFPKDLLSQDTWRINKVVNSLGQLYLPELNEDDRSSVREIVSSLYETPFLNGVQPGFNPALLKETVLSLGHVLDACAPKTKVEAYDDALHIHRTLEVFALSDAGFAAQTFFLIEILGNFLVFLDRFNSAQA